jgi:phosphomannomutase/phosphoglucomutase
MKVFGSSGVRGVANEELTPEFVVRIAKAAGSVWNADSVAVAQDTRATGTMFTDAAASGLASVGADVDRLGIVPTPGVQAHAAAERQPAIVVTASHNPPAFNGIKLVGSDGVELTRDVLERIEERFLAEDFDEASWAETGQTTEIDGVRRDYVDEVRAAVDEARIRDADLTIALDPGHGAGALTSPTLFRELGCRVVTLNAQPDPHFPGRDPEPIPENLGDLSRLVRTVNADVGIAHDGDADRAVFFDENGDYIEGDAALAVLAQTELEPDDTVVSAVNASQRLTDVAERADADVSLTAIGSTNIVTRIRDLQEAGETVPVAGEGNGGILFPDYRLARDGAYTAARFCELLADAPASELVAGVDDYYNVRANVHYDTEAEREELLETIEGVATDVDAPLDPTDGYRLSFDDGWVLARPSGTEPVIRIYAEARSRERAEELAAIMTDPVQKRKAEI